MESLDNFKLSCAFAVFDNTREVIRVADEGRDSIKLRPFTLICNRIDFEISIISHNLINCVASRVKHDDIAEAGMVLNTGPAT